MADGKTRRELFVYYRVAPRSVELLREAVTSMHAELQHAHEGLEARLLMRSDAEGSETWMETYARPASPGGVDAAIEARIAAAASTWAGLVDGERHIEAFISRG